MNYEPPQRVILTDAESELFSRIPGAPSIGNWTDEVASAMSQLATSLQNRDAISQARLKIFQDPEYAEAHSRSPMQIFEGNGTRGQDILRHPNFYDYLLYFVNGPDLPEGVCEGLCNILNNSMGTSGMIMKEYCKFARTIIRQYGLERKKAATAFFRLGIEIGMSVDDARILRDAAHTSR